MKLCPREQNLAMNILKLKYPSHVTSEHVHTVHFFSTVRIYRPRFIGKNKGYLGI